MLSVTLAGKCYTCCNASIAILIKLNALEVMVYILKIIGQYKDELSRKVNINESTMMMAGVGRKKSSLYHSINLIIAAQRSSVFVHTLH